MEGRYRGEGRGRDGEEGRGVTKRGGREREREREGGREEEPRYSEGQKGMGLWGQRSIEAKDEIHEQRKRGGTWTGREGRGERRGRGGRGKRGRGEGTTDRGDGHRKRERQRDGGEVQVRRGAWGEGLCESGRRRGDG